jgi:hypothetical protein
LKILTHQQTHVSIDAWEFQNIENVSFPSSLGEDFSQFACGSFIENKRIPDDQSKFDVFDILRNKLAYSIAGD